MTRLLDDMRARAKIAEGRAAGYRIAGDTDGAAREKRVAITMREAVAALQAAEGRS